MTHGTDSRWENPAIARGREAGLAVLRPTPAQLDAGLALHAEAVVVDTYGFSAMAAPSPQRVGEAVAAGLGPAACRRISIDSSMTRLAEDPCQQRWAEEAWQAAGVHGVLRNSGEEGQQVARLIERLAYNTFVSDRLPWMQRATTAADVQAARAAGRRSFIFTTNGVPLSLQEQDGEDELRYIRIFRLLGVRMMHLTYNRQNVLGSGCAERQDGGLSELGRAAIDQMHRQGVLVDLAHCGLQTSLEAAQHACKPVIISHATCLALREHCRGKSDAVMRAVAKTGGVMGIAAIPAFLGGSGDLNALLDHIDHAVRVMGVDHVAIGTDVATRLPPSSGDAAMPALPAGPSFLPSYWRPNDPLHDPAWNQPAMLASLAWTNWPLFTVGLGQRGYRDAEILKILGGNTLRVLASADG